MMQFSLISLIPGLIRNLQDCADPQFNSYEENLVMPTSLKTSERASCQYQLALLKPFVSADASLVLSYMGLPLQLFGKVSYVL